MKMRFADILLVGTAISAIAVGWLFSWPYGHVPTDETAGVMLLCLLTGATTLIACFRPRVLISAIVFWAAWLAYAIYAMVFLVIWEIDDLRAGESSMRAAISFLSEVIVIGIALPTTGIVVLLRKRNKWKRTTGRTVPPEAAASAVQ